MSDPIARIILKLRHAMLCSGTTATMVDQRLGWKPGSCAKLLSTHSHRLHLNGVSDIAWACNTRLEISLEAA